MEFRKNDLVTLEIEDCGIDGEGIGKADGFTVFVKDAVIGDTVTAKIIKAKKNYGYGRLMEVVKPSPYRVEPNVRFARQCGGCQLQALSYDQQLEFKTNKVKGHLETNRWLYRYPDGADHWHGRTFPLQKQGTVSCRKK